jgi:hypothetical protein
MRFDPEFVYDESKETIFLDGEDSRIEVYSKASRQEFELTRAAHEVPDILSALFAGMFETTEQLGGLEKDENYFDHIGALAQDAANLYRRCTQIHESIERNSPNVLSAQLDLLYTSEKNLKHFLRCLSAAQSLGVFSTAVAEL